MGRGLMGYASTVLRLDPHDADAHQTKLFLLLQTDQYAAALAMTQAPTSLPNESSTETEGEGSDRAFERAYSLYRLHREEEATGVLDDLKAKSGEEEVDRGVLHLEAQLVRGALVGRGVHADRVLPGVPARSLPGSIRLV